MIATIIELAHPSDPRFLIVGEHLPERIAVEDVGKWKYGKPLIVAPGPVDVVYEQPDGFGTDWVRPEDAPGNATSERVLREIEANTEP